MTAQTMTESQLVAISCKLASMNNNDLESVFRMIATEFKSVYLDDINCALRRVCTEQENLRLVTQ